MSIRLRNNRPSIPTVYNGTEFASKLEADWARLLDRERMGWKYEPGGQYVGNGDQIFVLCDFKLPELKQWLEVKGRWTEDELEKYERFGAWVQSGGEALFVAGPGGLLAGYLDGVWEPAVVQGCSYRARSTFRVARLVPPLGKCPVCGTHDVELEFAWAVGALGAEAVYPNPLGWPDRASLRDESPLDMWLYGWAER